MRFLCSGLRVGCCFALPPSGPGVAGAKLIASGVLIALFRESWTGLPAGIRGGTYVVSAVLLAAACFLIVRGGEER
jgi:hypothetical protein